MTTERRDTGRCPACRHFWPCAETCGQQVTRPPSTRPEDWGCVRYEFAGETQAAAGSDTERARLLTAAQSADWTQVVLNGGPPCFHIEDAGRFCFRAERWFGHGDDRHLHHHPFVALAEALASPPPADALLSRLTVVDETGRIYERRNVRLDLNRQDDGRTLKVFVSPADAPPAPEAPATRTERPCKDFTPRTAQSQRQFDTCARCGWKAVLHGTVPAPEPGERICPHCRHRWRTIGPCPMCYPSTPAFDLDAEKKAEAAATERERLPDCPNLTPPQWTGHWRDWHRGHGCKLDPDAYSAPPADAPPAPEPPDAEAGPTTESGESLQWIIRNIRLSAAAGRSFGHQATPQAFEKMAARKDAALDKVLAFCARAGETGSLLRHVGDGFDDVRADGGLPESQSPAPEPDATPDPMEDGWCPYCSTEPEGVGHYADCPHATKPEPDATPDEDEGTLEDRLRAKDKHWQRRSAGQLWDALKLVCETMWNGKPPRGAHVWTIPVDHERDFDCILADAIQELLARREAPPSTPDEGTALDGLCESESPNGAAFCMFSLGHNGPCDWEHLQVFADQVSPEQALRAAVASAMDTAASDVISELDYLRDEVARLKRQVEQGFQAALRQPPPEAEAEGQET